MGTLPQSFLDRMKEQLGDEYDSFVSCYEQEGYLGLRVNTSKISVEEFLKITPFSLTPVPWTENGFYYQKDEPVTRHPHYFAGLYYIQEPSAMLPASRLPVMPGDRVLDLCAAPGGKATELSSRLQGEGILITNDASASRAKALVKNLAIWGSKNCCITGETPQKLLQEFGCYFDKILVDAPCSGEGMFRRDSHLIDAWLEKAPEYYAPIQTEILDCAVQMLRPGGMLVYSTCTFSPEEDEGVIQTILERYQSLSLVQPPAVPGFTSGNAPCEPCIRIWPHKIKGEGHFLALLKKADDAPDMVRQDKPGSGKKIPPEVLEFLQLLPKELWKDRIYSEAADQCLLLPPYPIPKRLRYLRTGIALGTRKNGRFEPGQALAMVLDAASFPCVLDLSGNDERCVRYLKGETLELTDAEAKGKKGWMLVCVDGYPLGWGKCAGGSLKNKYYPGWRLQ